MIRRNTCLLCGRQLEDLTGGVQKHPDVVDCEVIYTDAWGVAWDLKPEQAEPDLKPPIEDDSEPIFIKTFPFVDEILLEIFESFGLPRLGGISSGRGWSSISTFERCPYLWKRKYIDQAKHYIAVESPSLAIGTLVHVFMGLHYAAMMSDSPYRVLTPEMVYERVRLRANPEFVKEAWRLFTNYRLYYQHEIITPLAVEYDLRDPRTGESCRYDLIALIDRELPELSPGTYIVEHKTAGRFDDATLNGWSGDGEVLGQIALWQKCGMDKRFGPLKGVIMNILGKQKEPKLHRTYVAPDSWRVQSHLEDLRRVEGLINLAKSTDSFPRYRGNCFNRYGKCDWWEHCASNG